MEASEKLDLLRAMIRIRAFETALMARADHGFQLLSSGQEAVSVGLCAALTADDLMLSSGVASPGSGFSSTLHDVRCRVAAADGGVIIPASSMQVLAPDSTARLQVGIASGQRVVTSTPMVGAGVVRTLLGFNFDRGFRVSVQ